MAPVLLTRVPVIIPAHAGRKGGSMPVIFNPTAEERRALEALIAAIPQIQDKLVVNHRQLTRPDRGAHQQQIAGGKVLLTLEPSLPPALSGLGVFQHDGSA